MKCEQCGNEVKIKEAKFCPFCGGAIEQKEKLAGYTRAQFFSVTGDEEFAKSWNEIRNMSAAEFLSWIREHPTAKYVWKIYGKYRDGRRTRRMFVYKSEVKELLKEPSGEVYARKSIFTFPDLIGNGVDIFNTEEECNAAIKEETNES